MPWKPGPLVVGFDDGDAGEHALRYALDMAEQLAVPLHVVHVIELRDFPVDPDLATWEGEVERYEADLTQRVASIMTLPRERWTYQAVRGDPWHALLNRADEVDAWMIVVGQHTHANVIASFVSRALGSGRAGSVGASLARHSTRPVLIVPGGLTEGDDRGP